VFRWPDAHAVENALRAWVARVTAERSEVRSVGYFGSYARGDWGVGSDVDLIVIVAGSEDSFERRAAGWNTSSLPVPADLLVYTDDEWQAMQRGGRLSERMTREIIWLYDRAEMES
jgi:hypothetical protein